MTIRGQRSTAKSILLNKYHKRIVISVFILFGFGILLGNHTLKAEYSKAEPSSVKMADEFPCVNGDKIEKNEENPYSTETNSGVYMHDIFEANRGAYVVYEYDIREKNLSENCFKDEFTYSNKFNPYKDENYYIDWKIRLSEMAGSSTIAQAVNEYHKLLFQDTKREMIELEKKAKELFYEEGIEEFNFYSRNIETYAAYCHGDIFTLVDVENNHQSSGCSVVTGNFNMVSGERYDLTDLFTTDNFSERLFEEILKSEQAEANEGRVSEWKNYLFEYDENERSFLIGYHGLLLFHNTWQRTITIEWERIEDILSQEIKNAMGDSELEITTR